MLIDSEKLKENIKKVMEEMKKKGHFKQYKGRN